MSRSIILKCGRALGVLVYSICLGSVIVLSADLAAIGGEKLCGNEVVPLIVIDGVPLSDAIRNLARQMEMNHILHPAVPGSGFTPGNLVQEPLVSRRWENVTVAEALRDVLNEHRLILLTNSLTTVARVAPNRPGVRPLQNSLTGPDTKRVVPVIKLEDVMMREALEYAGRLAGLRVWFAPEVPASLLEETLRVRWKHLTARQALAALLDNYGLIVEENPVTKGARVRLKD